MTAPTSTPASTTLSDDEAGMRAATLRAHAEQIRPSPADVEEASRTRDGGTRSHRLRVDAVIAAACDAGAEAIERAASLALQLAAVTQYSDAQTEKLRERGTDYALALTRAETAERRVAALEGYARNARDALESNHAPLASRAVEATNALEIALVSAPVPRPAPEGTASESEDKSAGQEGASAGPGLGAVGSRVTLPDGRFGDVVRVEGDCHYVRPDAPLVRVRTP